LFLDLLAWLIFTIPTAPFCTQLAGAAGLSDGNFPSELQEGERLWKAATYRGITIGKSTAKELFQKWGRPKSTGNWDWDNPKKPKFPLYDYDVQEWLTGTVKVEVETKTGKVISIEISPDELSLNRAIELFGEDYIETRYKSCECDPGDETPMFESLDGNYLYIEYRRRGIAMFISHNGQVNSIQFVDKPIGLKSIRECEKIPECRSERKSAKRKKS